MKIIVLMLDTIGNGRVHKIKKKLISPMSMKLQASKNTRVNYIQNVTEPDANILNLNTLLRTSALFYRL